MKVDCSFPEEFSSYCPDKIAQHEMEFFTPLVKVEGTVLGGETRSSLLNFQAKNVTGVLKVHEDMWATGCELDPYTSWIF